MFLFFPFSYGFSLLCVFGSLFAISSCNWLAVWLGLEINLLGFVPLMVQGFSQDQGVESSVKYFVVQSLGSSFILLGGFSLGDCFLSWFFCSNNLFFFMFCFFGLCLKLGVAPLHWWVPSVMGGLSWFCCGVLLTWQKLGPFLVLSSFSSGFCFMFLFLGALSSVVGGVLGVGQVQVRLLMAYSSIGHWGWLLSILSVSFLSGFFYFLFYFLLSVCLFYFFHGGGMGRLNQVSSSNFFFVFLGFLSLGGLPPLSGFVMKMIGIQTILVEAYLVWIVFLILGSLLSLYYYLNFLFMLVISRNLYLNFSSFSHLFLSFFLVVVLMGLPFYEIFSCLLYAVGLFY